MTIYFPEDFVLLYEWARWSIPDLVCWGLFLTLLLAGRWVADYLDRK